MVDDPHSEDGAHGAKNRQFLRYRVDRLELVKEFAKRVGRWLREDYDPSGFGYRSDEDREDGYGFDLKLLDVQGLMRKLPKINKDAPERDTPPLG